MVCVCGRGKERGEGERREERGERREERGEGERKVGRREESGEGKSEDVYAKHGEIKV